MKINNLANFRYSITSLLNDSQKTFAAPQSLPLTMATTYEKLIQHHMRQLKETCKLDSLQQIERNHQTALRAFLKMLQKSASSPIGMELTDDFDAALKKHLQASGLSERSQIDRKSLLTQWRNSYVSMGESAPMRTGRERTRASDIPSEQNPFEKALWVALKVAKLSPKTAAIRANISTSAIGRWSRGAIPNVRSVSTFEKLEKTLGAQPGTLTEAFNQATGKDQSRNTDDYRERLKERKKLVYALIDRDVSPALKAEWTAYLQYKTSKIGTALKRPKGSGWSLVAPRDATMTPSFFWSVGTMVCPSASSLSDFLPKFATLNRYEKHS